MFVLSGSFQNMFRCVVVGCHKSSWSMKSSTPCNMHKLYKINQIDTIRGVVSTGLRKGILCSHLILSFKCPLHLSTDCLAEKRILLNRRWFTRSRQLSLKGVISQPFSGQSLSAIIILSMSKLLPASASANSSEFLAINKHNNNETFCLCQARC